jgi:hypothetical protein
VGLGEELLGVTAEQQRLLVLVRDAHGEHVEVRDARLFGIDALLPRPREAFVLSLVGDRECEIVGALGDVGEGECDPSDVGLRCHGEWLLWYRAS